MFAFPIVFVRSFAGALCVAFFSVSDFTCGPFVVNMLNFYLSTYVKLHRPQIRHLMLQFGKKCSCIRINPKPHSRLWLLLLIEASHIVVYFEKINIETMWEHGKWKRFNLLQILTTFLWFMSPNDFTWLHIWNSFVIIRLTTCGTFSVSALIKYRTTATEHHKINMLEIEWSRGLI